MEFSDVSKLSEIIDYAWEGKSLNEKPRAYLGASIIGHPCERYLWLTFRWAYRERLNGQTERLLETGRREEKVAVENLQFVGVNIKYTGENQCMISYPENRHIQAHPDGIILSGVPEAPKAIHIWEHKTMNNANFRDLLKKGVKEAKPMHYAQMQVEMYGYKNCDRALYQVLNKDTSEIYTVRLRYAQSDALGYLNRAAEIIDRDDAPPKASEKWQECKMCSFRGLCHGNTSPCVNCRTCVYFSATKDGKCWCALKGKETPIPLSVQYTGCDAHIIHPDLVPWEHLMNEDRPYQYCYWIGDLQRKVFNGYGALASWEILKEVETFYGAANIPTNSN